MVSVLAELVVEDAQLGRAFDAAGRGLLDVDVRYGCVVYVFLGVEGDGCEGDGFAREPADALLGIVSRSCGIGDWSGRTRARTESVSSDRVLFCGELMSVGGSTACCPRMLAYHNPLSIEILKAGGFGGCHGCKVAYCQPKSLEWRTNCG